MPRSLHGLSYPPQQSLSSENITAFIYLSFSHGQRSIHFIAKTETVWINSSQLLKFREAKVSIKAIAVLLINHHNYSMGYRNHGIESTSLNAGCLILSKLWLYRSASDCARIGILSLSSQRKKQQMQRSMCKDGQSTHVRQPSFSIHSILAAQNETETDPLNFHAHCSLVSTQETNAKYTTGQNSRVREQW